MLNSKITQRKKATNINSTSQKILHERDVPGLLERMLMVKMRANKKEKYRISFCIHTYFVRLASGKYHK
jgi:hypothetical protein